MKRKNLLHLFLWSSLYNSWIWLKTSSQPSLLSLELLLPVRLQVQDWICSESLHCTKSLGHSAGQVPTDSRLTGTTVGLKVAFNQHYPGLWKTSSAVQKSTCLKLPLPLFSAQLVKVNCKPISLLKPQWKPGWFMGWVTGRSQTPPERELYSS